LEAYKKMPSGDRTGPEGVGPRTGRALGYCSGYDDPGYTKGLPRGGRGYGRRYGRGYGRGFCWGRRRACYPYPDEWYYPNRYPAYPTEPYPEMKREDEKHYLENLVKNLENELKQIKKRLQDLGKKNSEETP
jgi:hypothetical protein